MKTPINRTAGQRGRVTAMATIRKSTGEVFTVSNKSGNTGGDVLVRYQLPNGKTATVLDRKVYEQALKVTGSAVRRTLDDIRKHGGKGS
ncbi:hypothetical protein ACVINW_006331 [Bradyrhizobium sp. USDA 4461]